MLLSPALFISGQLFNSIRQKKLEHGSLADTEQLPTMLYLPPLSQTTPTLGTQWDNIEKLMMDLRLSHAESFFEL